jgi:hypothetical protein
MSNYLLNNQSLIFNLLSSKGDIKILEYYKNIGFNFNDSFIVDVFFTTSACMYGYEQLLKWLKTFPFFKYNNDSIFIASYNEHIKILKFFIQTIHIKKVIKFSKPVKIITTIKYKTKNNYIKGYNKN